MAAFSEKIDLLRQKFLCEREDENCIQVPWWLRILFAIAGGTCVFISFPDYNQFYLAWICLALEMWAIEGLTPKKAFWVALLAGTVNNVGGFYWLESTLEIFGHFPIWLSWVMCVLVCMVQALLYGVWGALSRGLKTKKPYLTTLTVFLTLELLWPMIFPWFLANSQHNFVPALQIADIFGVLGVDALLVCVNMLLFDFTKTLWLRHRGNKVAYNKKLYGIAGAYIVFCMIYAPIRMAQVDQMQAEAPKLRIGMVEGDVGVWQIETEEKIKNNLFIHHSLSKQLEAEGADLIIWPESGYQSPYIWASRMKEGSALDYEVDALYAKWFQPQAKRIYGVIDTMFGEEFRSQPPVHEALHHAMSSATRNYQFANIDMYYTAFANGYAVPCRDHKPFVHKCPYISVTPDDVTWYYPSGSLLPTTRNDDLAARVRPYDMAAPLRDLHTALFFGTLTVDKQGPDEESKSVKEMYRGSRGDRKLYNAAKLIEADGKVIGSYHKKYLMPFGEYIPFGDKFPEIYDLIPEAGNLTRGDAPNVLEFRGYTMAPIICYEDILPRYVNEFAPFEPQVFLNITDDAWFGKTSEPWQHMALAALRSVEHRKWLVRSTNTGVSVFVDANGRYVSHTSVNDAETLIEDVPMMPKSRTIYSYIGDLIGWLSFAWVVFIAFLQRSGRKRKAKVAENEVSHVDPKENNVDN